MNLTKAPCLSFSLEADSVKLSIHLSYKTSPRVDGMFYPFRKYQLVNGLVLSALLLGAALAHCTVLALFPVLAYCSEWTPQTVVSIQGEQFFINGKPTYEGVIWKPASGGEYKIEGLLLNARMVQGIFDDLNPDTRDRWAYPDTGKWDANRNTDEFVQAMADWRAHGLIGFTINLQGGSPEGYSESQPWHNSAIAADGSLRDDFMERLSRILKRADELGMVAILGYYYFGQDERVDDEAAVIRSVENATKWVLERGFRNVIIEINNECNVRAYDHDILKPDRVHELIDRAKAIQHAGRRLYVSTSYGGGTIPGEKVIAVSDYVLLHGNGVRDPKKMDQMVQTVRKMTAEHPKPIINNEDDRPWRDAHQGWGDDSNNFAACVKNYASWGFFDFREQGEAFEEGYQSIPVDWKIGSERKKSFFGLLKRITEHSPSKDSSKK